MDYFFTAPLTGCSIGFGNADRVGRTWVGHANAATAAVNLKNYLDSRGTKPTVAVLRTAQQLKQQKMLVGAGLHNVQGPANYGHHRLESKERLVTTLIGFRDRNNGRWSFIRQTFDQTLFV
jgi:hypothetical protein